MSDLVNSHEQLIIDLALLSQALMGLGRDDDALEVHELVVQVSDRTGIALSLLDEIDTAGHRDAARRRVGAERAAAAERRGRAVPEGRLVDRALELAGPR